MSRRSKTRGIPLSCLGPKALAQIAALGPPTSSLRKFDPPPVESEAQHKFRVSASDERTADGIVFDSKLEMNAYRQLMNFRISFTRQPEYLLQPGFVFQGKKIREVKYLGDFLLDPEGRKILVDLKGFRTEAFKLKWKLLLFKYPELDAVQIKTLPALMKLLLDRGFLNR